MSEEFTHTLTTPFEYANKGNLGTATFISFSPPTAKNITECSKLKQAFFRALPKDNLKGADLEEAKELAKEKAKGKDSVLNADEIMMMLSTAASVELSEVFINFKILLTSPGISLVEGEEKFTKPLFDLLSMDDLEEIAGKYYANFILASSLSKI